MVIILKTFTIKVVTIIFSLCGASLVILSTSNYGIGVSPDSVEYLATASNLLTGRGFISFDEQPILQFPPLYPITLFLFSYISGYAPSSAAVAINSILFGLIIYKTGTILIKYIDYTPLIIIGLILIIFSIPIFSMALWAWSELLFIFITVLYIKSLTAYIEKESLLSFLVVAVVSSLGMLTRYIGISFIITTVITILIFYNHNLLKKILSILVYTVLAIIPISIWLIRNYIISDTIAGERGTSRISLTSNIYLTIDKILLWNIPDSLFNLKIFLLITFASIIIFFWLRVVKKIKFKKLRLLINEKMVIISFFFLLTYLILLIMISTHSGFNPIDDRLLSPVYIPLMIILLFILQGYSKQINNYKYPKISRIILFIFLFLLIVKPFTYTLEMFKIHYEQGSGYSGISWQKDDKRKWLNDILSANIKESTIYSNDPFAVYFLTNKFTKWIPNKNYPDSDDIHIRLTDLKKKWPPEKAAHLIWFEVVEFHRRTVYKPHELATISEITKIDSSLLGSLYFIIRK